MLFLRIAPLPVCLSRLKFSSFVCKKQTRGGGGISQETPNISLRGTWNTAKEDRNAYTICRWKLDLWTSQRWRVQQQTCHPHNIKTWSWVSRDQVHTDSHGTGTRICAYRCFSTSELATRVSSVTSTPVYQEHYEQKTKTTLGGHRHRSQAHTNSFMWVAPWPLNQLAPIHKPKITTKSSIPSSRPYRYAYDTQARGSMAPAAPR